MKSTKILAGVFIALFVQLQAILFYSLLVSHPPVFVQSFIPQLDLSDFVIATTQWLRHADPYLRGRFVTPPPSLLLALPLEHLSPAHAAFLFYLTTLAVLTASLVAICRHFRLDGNQSLLFFGIASLYFPVFFLVERGNLDGIMLALVLTALFARNSVVRAAALALSVGLKLYTAALFAPLLATRASKRILLAFIFLCLLLLPFHALILPFLHTQASRSTGFQLTENISPGLLFRILVTNPRAPLEYGLLWLFTYAAALVRHRRASLEVLSLYSLPWMAALPAQVFPYTGILLLPLLIFLTRTLDQRRTVATDFLFLVGFVLVGFQQTAWHEFFHGSLFARVVTTLPNAVGMTLVIASIAFAPRDRVA